MFSVLSLVCLPRLERRVISRDDEAVHQLHSHYDYDHHYYHYHSHEMTVTLLFSFKHRLN